MKSYFVKLCNETCGTTRFRIEGFDLNLHIDAEFALRDTGRCDSKKNLHDPTNDNFPFFLFLLYHSTDLRINSLGRPSLVRLPVVGLLGSRVGREKYALLSTPPPRPFLTRISRRFAPTVWRPGRGYSTYFNRVLNEHFCFTDNINENHVSLV